MNDKRYDDPKNLDMSILLKQQTDIITNVFPKSIHLGRDEFVKTVFRVIFDLIPEAHKGMFLILKNGFYIPIASVGYDHSVMKYISFKAEDMFFRFEPSVKQVEVKFDELDDFTVFMDVLKHLDITDDFISLNLMIMNANETVGVLTLENFDFCFFSEISVSLIKYYGQLIANFSALKTLQQTEKKKNNSIISALVSAIEVKDKYTKGHARRVQEIAINIAIALGLNHQELSDIHTASILHDVGKIGIPDDILLKPGRLTKEEYEIVKEHPTHTKHILAKISGFETVVLISHLHHEHYDGGGYPIGLKGNEIPIGAQVIQIADAFDAMTSDRAYRKAMSYREALELISKESGKQFPPNLVEIMLKLYG